MITCALEQKTEKRLVKFVENNLVYVLLTVLKLC